MTDLDKILDGIYQGDKSRSDIKEELLDWHNKQVEEVIKKPHILPKNAQHQESVKQGINFYHRQMRKAIERIESDE